MIIHDQTYAQATTTIDFDGTDTIIITVDGADETLTTSANENVAELRIQSTVGTTATAAAQTNLGFSSATAANVNNVGTLLGIVKIVVHGAAGTQNAVMNADAYPRVELNNTLENLTLNAGVKFLRYGVAADADLAANVSGNITIAGSVSLVDAGKISLTCGGTLTINGTLDAGVTRNILLTIGTTATQSATITCAELQVITGTLIVGAGITGNVAVYNAILDGDNTITGDLLMKPGCTIRFRGTVTGNCTSEGDGTKTIHINGDAAGTLTVNNDLTLDADTTVNFTVNSGAHDQIIVGDAVNLSGASLTGNGTTVALSAITLLTTNSGGAINGTFSGVAEGAVVLLGVTNGKLSYVADDGNNIGFAPVPSVTNVSSPDPNNTYGVGANLTIDVTFSDLIDVIGSPQLALNSGGTATFQSVVGGNTARFSYTVAAGHSSADLDYANVNALTLNDGTITRQGEPGVNANLTLPAVGGPGSLGANKNIVIATDVTFDLPAAGNYRVRRNGANIEIVTVPGMVVVFSQPAGMASLTINGIDGAADTLEIDLADGDCIPAGGLIFNGGTGGPDRIRVLAAGANITYSPSSTTQGNGTISATGFGTITFTGLE